MKLFKKLLQKFRAPLKKADRFLHQLFALESDTLANPLRGDRAVEYAFIVEDIKNRPKNANVLDIGAAESPLTTIVASLGFDRVDAVDLMPTPVNHPQVNFFVGNFLDDNFVKNNLQSQYDNIILCSTVEHFGLERYGSAASQDADIKCLEKLYQLLKLGGYLFLTIPYGQAKIIYPFHRVYNKTSPLILHLYKNFKIEKEKYFKNNQNNVWVLCSEQEAASVWPSSDNYALGLFIFKKF